MIRCNFPESRLRFRVFSFSLKALVVFSTKMELKKKKKSFSLYHIWSRGSIWVYDCEFSYRFFLTIPELSYEVHVVCNHPHLSQFNVEKTVREKTVRNQK